MGLIPSPASLVSLGLARLFRGLRTGDQLTLLAGAALAALGYLRRSADKERVLVRREVLKPGQSLVIRAHDADD